MINSRKSVYHVIFTFIYVLNINKEKDDDK